MGPSSASSERWNSCRCPWRTHVELLDLDGMDVQTALNVRDKSRMKTVLRAAGVPCARHQLVTNPAEALGFAEEVGFRWWQSLRRAPERRPHIGSMMMTASRLAGRDSSTGRPGLLEEFLVGEEHTFDSITIGGQTVFSSIADYQPTPLEVLRQPWIQWTVLLLGKLDDPRYNGIWEIGPAALQAPGVRDALTHMEWFAGRTARLPYRRSRRDRRVRRSAQCSVRA